MEQRVPGLPPAVCEMAEHRLGPGEAEPALVPEGPPTAQVGLSDHTAPLFGELIHCVSE